MKMNCWSRVRLALAVATAMVAFSMLVAAQDEVAVTCPPSQYLDAESNKCVDFESPASKAKMDLSMAIDSGNTAWMLTSSALVMLMTPGLAFFYAGLAGEDMATNTIMMSYISLALVSIQFFAFGYSLAFSPGGYFDLAGYNNVGGIASVYGGGIPSAVFAFFQTQFASITPALISGGVVGRMKFGTYILFVLIWTTVIYDPLARIVWAAGYDSEYTFTMLGWGGKMGTLDFAGGTCIEVASGFSGLAAALVVGKRYNHGEPVKPHNVPLVMIGTALLWFGWFGFNAGSAGAASSLAGITAINTHLAASSAFLTWIMIEWVLFKTLDPCGAASGAVAGLVAITPACGYVYPWAAVIIGAIGSAVALGGVHLKNYLRYDDTLDVFAIHGLAGYTGGLLTGVFASKEINPAAANGMFYGNPIQLWYQFVSFTFAAVYCVVGTFLILMVLKYTVGLRVSEDKEIGGMDNSYHGGAAYINGGSTHGPNSPVMNKAGDFKLLHSPNTQEQA